MKISKFIKRLEKLRSVAGEDVEVAVPSRCNSDLHEIALAELQQVTHTPLYQCWRSRAKDNTHQIIVVR